MRKFGVISILLGIVLLLGALGLMIYNKWEADSADEASAQILAQIQGETVVSGNQELQTDFVSAFDEEAQEEYAEMTVTEIDGYGYIGYLSIPALELELPVMSQCDYERLRIAPCRQYGAVRSRDLVLCAHNYDTHFGKCGQLRSGDLLTFTDMDQTAFLYRVEYVEVIRPKEISFVRDSDFDLVLYTCTYGGENRVCVFCNLVEV